MAAITEPVLPQPTEKQLRATLKNIRYAHAGTTAKHLCALLDTFKDLKPSVKEYVYASGKKTDLMQVNGTLPVWIAGGTYNIPVRIWLLRGYPGEQPHVHINPTPDMAIAYTVGYVGMDGRVRLPYLSTWKEGKSDLTTLVQIVRARFSQECPVYSKTPDGPSIPLTPRTQRIHTTPPRQQHSYTTNPSIQHTPLRAVESVPHTSVAQQSAYMPASNMQHAAPVSQQSAYMPQAVSSMQHIAPVSQQSAYMPDQAVSSMQHSAPVQAVPSSEESMKAAQMKLELQKKTREISELQQNLNIVLMQLQRYTETPGTDTANQMAQMEDALKLERATRETCQQRLDSTRRDLRETRQEVRRLRAVGDDLKQKLAQVLEDLSDSTGQIAKLNREKKELEEKLQLTQAELAAQVESVLLAKSAVEVAETTDGDTDTERSLQQQLNSANAEVKLDKVEIQLLRSAKEEIQQQLKQSQTELKKLLKSNTELEKEIQQLRAAKKEVQQKLIDFEEQLKSNSVEETQAISLNFPGDSTDEDDDEYMYVKIPDIIREPTVESERQHKRGVCKADLIIELETARDEAQRKLNVALQDLAEAKRQLQELLQAKEEVRPLEHGEENQPVENIYISTGIQVYMASDDSSHEQSASPEIQPAAAVEKIYVSTGIQLYTANENNDMPDTTCIRENYGPNHERESTVATEQQGPEDSSSHKSGTVTLSADTEIRAHNHTPADEIPKQPAKEQVEQPAEVDDNLAEAKEPLQQLPEQPQRREEPAEAKEQPSEAKEQLPEAKEQPSEAKEQSPEAKEQSPEAKEQLPEAKEQPSEAKEQSPEAKEQSPEAKEQPSEGKEQSPEAKEQSPEAKEQPSEGKEQSPEAKEQSPEAKEQSPEAKEQSPEAKEQSPEAKEQSPEAKEQSPEAKEQSPEAKEQSPEAKEQPPEAKEQSPEERPSTLDEPSKQDANQVPSEGDTPTPSPEMVTTAPDNDLSELDRMKSQLEKAHEEAKLLKEKVEEMKDEKQALLDSFMEQIEQTTDIQFQRDELQQKLDNLLLQMQSSSPEHKQEINIVSYSDVELLTHKMLGTGAWGYVIEGKFRGKTVAVKCLHKSILSDFSIGHLQREISIMSDLRHPNLVLFIAAVLDAPTGPMIITELLNQNLRTAYEEDTIKSCKLSILHDVACALNYLHLRTKPIIHRDVSSANVLLEEMPKDKWKAKLSDFGSANLVRVATTPGEGAVIYAAPEMRTSAHKPQAPPIDVYSYGVVLCEVVTGTFPQRDKFPHMLELTESQWPDVYDIITQCIRENPGERIIMGNIITKLDKLIKSGDIDL